MIKNIFIRCLMPFKKMRDRYKVRAALSKLALHKHPKLKAIGLALRESLSQTFSDEEQKWIDLITDFHTANNL